MTFDENIFAYIALLTVGQASKNNYAIVVCYNFVFNIAWYQWEHVAESLLNLTENWILIWNIELYKILRNINRYKKSHILSSDTYLFNFHNITVTKTNVIVLQNININVSSLLLLLYIVIIFYISIVRREQKDNIALNCILWNEWNVDTRVYKRFKIVCFNTRWLHCIKKLVIQIFYYAVLLLDLSTRNYLFKNLLIALYDLSLSWLHLCTYLQFIATYNWPAREMCWWVTHHVYYPAIWRQRKVCLNLCMA